MIDIFKSEIYRNLALPGCPMLDSLNPSWLQPDI